MLLGHTCVCAVEIEPYRRKVLLQRQRDGILPKFPIWDDIRTFDGTPWGGKVDVVCAGIPCQKTSSRGLGGGFIEEDYYQSFRNTVGDIGSPIVFVENSPMLLVRGFGGLLSDMASMGYDARWCVLGASEAGFCHRRRRLWALFTDPKRCEWWKESHGWKARRMGWGIKPVERDRDWQRAMSTFRGMDDGLAYCVDRTDSIRNGQVPAVVKLAWETLMQ
jgi:DNA (cytosine-5)-methyltransferase 1